jgi:hypothetical protein
MAVRVAAVVALVLLAAACGDDSEGGAVTGTAPSTTSRSPATSASAAASTTSVADVELLVVLTPDGLGFTTEGSGAISRVDFGSARSLVVDTVAKSLGTPAAQGTQHECAPAPSGFARWDEISLFFDGDTFAGWSVNGEPLTTADGIGVGSTLDEFEAAYGHVTVEDTSLGQEFFDGPYVGSVDGSGVIDRLDAGTICAFR